MILWIENPDIWPAALAQAVAARLPAEIVRRAARYRDPIDGQAILLGRALLAALLDHVGVPGRLADIEIGPHGKPVLAGAGDFSIAHAGARVVCARAAYGRIGIDVEPLRPVEIADYGAVLSDIERRSIAGAADPASAMLRLWTVKEAVAKAAGTGLTGTTSPQIENDGPISFAGACWHLRRPDFGDYALAVATETAGDLPLVACRLDPHGHVVLCDPIDVAPI